MKKIKILHIIKSLGRGGAEVLLPETLKLHDKNKFEFHYIYFLPWKNQMVSSLEKEGGKVTCFSASNNVQLLLQRDKIIDYCRTNHIDLIHCHLPWSGFLGRTIFRRTRIPLVYTEHNIQERYHKVTKFINKLSFNNQRLALGVSQDVTDSIEKNVKPKIPVITSLNGVNTSRFKRDSIKGKQVRQQWDIPEGAVVIGNVAVFREQKCIPGWLKAFKLINEDHPDVYGILVGAGPLEREVQQLVKDYELSERVKLVGLQTDTISYFSAIDIFLMSSAFEGLPIALLEAMSMECAIVSTRAGGVTEVVRDRKDGLLCEVGSWDCLAEKSITLIENPVLREEYQEAGRERIRNSFGLHKMVEKLEKIYQAQLGKRK